MYRKVFLVIIYSIMFFITSSESPAGTTRKPLPPLAITINPAQTGLNPADIKPGDTVIITIIARAMTALPEATIKITLSNGMELVSGEKYWSGALSNEEVKELKITVRAPLKGSGMIKARIMSTGAQGPAFSAESQYTIGEEYKAENAPKTQIKKDKKGRGIVEYR